MLTILLADILEESLPQRIQFGNWEFILFLACFFIFIYAMNVGPKLLTTMAKGLIGRASKESIFAEQINNELLIKLLLCSQTIMLTSLIFFNTYLFRTELSPEIEIQMFPFIGKTYALILAFLLYKAFFYNIIGNIFFSKENIRHWNNYFMSIISLSGFVLFLPSLLMFYVEKIFYFCCVFYLFFFIFIIFIVFRKIYLLFFPHKMLSLHFILYLCAQEIIPLYFLYKGLHYLFVIV